MPNGPQSCSTAAHAAARGAGSGGPSAQLPLCGSKTSTVARGLSPLTPPMTSSRPSTAAAHAPMRAPLMRGASAHAPTNPSSTSTLALAPCLPSWTQPPATYSRPSTAAAHAENRGELSGGPSRQPPAGCPPLGAAGCPPLNAPSAPQSSSSTEASPAAAWPPHTKPQPLRTAAHAPNRASGMSGAACHTPSDVSRTSTEARGAPVLSLPPQTNSLPQRTNAHARARGVASEGASTHRPVRESKSSTVARGASSGPLPPMTYMQSPSVAEHAPTRGAALGAAPCQQLSQSRSTVETATLCAWRPWERAAPPMPQARYTAAARSRFAVRRGMSAWPSSVRRACVSTSLAAALCMRGDPITSDRTYDGAIRGKRTSESTSTSSDDDGGGACAPYQATTASKTLSSLSVLSSS
mmetsp:Transcript_60620/g.166023  ORF Transcript_60620/g.166023 Transcript_60620/m.166023 type:complete len:410 (+) Transcript_60620:360-1589(+)